jgi:hypothetical protein
MKLNFWPPAFIFESQELRIAGTKGFVVHIQPDAPDARLQHELWHVRQNWVFLFIGSVILNATKWGQFHLEAAAFGHELNFVDDASGMLDVYAEFLAGPEYSHGRTKAECRTQIEKKYARGGLI